MGYASTTAPGEIWIAGQPPTGPFGLSVTHAGIAADLATRYQTSSETGPGLASYLLPDDSELTVAVDRAWKLAMSLPPTPLVTFEAAVSGLPRTTEVERLVVQRIGQEKFRDALMSFWGGRCPLTGISEPALLRASHIIPWADCESDAERLDVNNGLLLSSLWDAAFDSGYVTFDDAGRPIPSRSLSTQSLTTLGIEADISIRGLTSGHRDRLAIHREKTFIL